MKEKLNKAKEFVKENKWVIVAGVETVALLVGGGIVLTKAGKMRAIDKEYKHFIDMTSISNWGHIGSGRNTWKVEDLGKYGEYLINRFAEDGCTYVKADSEITGINIIGMKSES